MASALEIGLAAFRDHETENVPSSGIHRVEKANVRDYIRAVDEDISGAEAGLVSAETWAVLAAIAGTRAGQPGRVIGPDAGTHTDPVVGGTVANTGEFRWSVSPAGWKRIAALEGFTSALDDLRDELIGYDATLNAAILTEQTIRTNADTAEALARTVADNSIIANYTTLGNIEAAARIAADNLEIAARTAADAKLVKIGHRAPRRRARVLHANVGRRGQWQDAYRHRDGGNGCRAWAMPAHSRHDQCLRGCFHAP